MGRSVGRSVKKGRAASGESFVTFCVLLTCNTRQAGRLRLGLCSGGETNTRRIRNSSNKFEGLVTHRHQI